VSKLFISTGGWVFEPTPAQLVKTEKKNPVLAGGHWDRDADGREMCLIIQPTVFCELVSWQGVYPKSGAEKRFPTYFVPASVCAGCEHFWRKVGRAHIICRLTSAERAATGGEEDYRE